MENLIYVGLVVIAILVIAIIFIGRLKDPTIFSPYKKKLLLTKPEMVMLNKIQRAIEGSGLYVSSQVSMGALINLKRNVDSKQRMGLRNRFNRKIVDYVIVGQSGMGLILIELDDTSHSPIKDAERDSMTRSAGYHTIRYKSARGTKIEQIREDIFSVLQTHRITRKD